jgi:2-dehydro-3-deoxy-phosphogluconate aldolase
MQQINFYRQRVAINVLAKDIANAREIYDAAEGHAVIGVLSAQFSTVDEGVAEVRRWMTKFPLFPSAWGQAIRPSSIKRR